MKVKEIIEALSKVDGELEVWIADNDFTYECEIEDIIRIKNEKLTQPSKNTNKNIDKIYLIN